MRRISIIGLGLMGGSLGLSLKRTAYDTVRVGYARREVVREAAMREDVVDEVYGDVAEAVRDADLVVLCAPIYTIPELLADCKEVLKAGAIITDVGSTKTELMKSCSELLADSDAVFVGSHPIAGSEQQGIEAALADLYVDAVVVVTPGEAEQPDATEALAAFWESQGSRVTVMDAARHDRLLARTSHLPHLVATALARTVGRDESDADVGLFCGPGFRDTSRIADGAASVWLDIVQSNAVAVREELAAYRKVVDECLRAMDAGDYPAIEALLEDGRQKRRRLLKDGLKKDDEG